MAFQYRMTGPGPEAVERVEVDAVAPKAGQLQVRIRASSLNFHDLVTLSGFIPTVDYPCVPLSDGCGEVTAVGAGVDAYALGDRVLPIFFPLWLSGRPSWESKKYVLGERVDGCMQEYFTLDAASAVRAPSNLDDEQAATLNCAALTAWYALIEEAKLQPGQTVLVQGSGGVSLFALQFAKAIGATVVATSSSDDKLAKMTALGADHTVNYSTHPDWEKQVLALCGGVDAVVDVGGQGTLAKTVSCTNTDGFIAVIGVLGGFEAASVSVIDIMQKNLTLKGVTVGCAESFDRMCRFIEQHAIEPVISHTLGAAELGRGLELMQSGQHFGKIAIRIE